MSLDKLFSFSRLVTEFGRIPRAVRIPKTEDWENDVEHSYHLAMMAWYIVDSNSVALNKDLILTYALVHDFVEVHAGDTYIYSEDIEHLASKKEREHAAALKLRKELPEFSALHANIEKYEKQEDDESKFVWALDKILPILHGYDDAGRTWREQGVTLQMLLDKKGPQVAVSKEVQEYFGELANLLERNQESLFGTRTTGQA